MQEVHYQSLKEIVEKASGQSIDAMTELVIRLYVLGIAQFTCEWILGKWEATAEELGTVFEQTFPAPLQEYAGRSSSWNSCR